MSDKPAARELPVPFGQRINERVLADRLPIPFRRPLGYAPDADYVPVSPEPDKPIKPYMPPTGQVRVAQHWGLAHRPIQEIGVGLSVRQSTYGIAHDAIKGYSPLVDIAHCCRGDTIGLNEANICLAITSGQSDLFVSHLDALRPKAHALSASAQAAINISKLFKYCLGGAYHSGGNSRLRSCASPEVMMQADLDKCVSGLSSKQTAIKLCHSSTHLPALDVPCEWYEIPLDDDPLLPTWVCGLRPEFNRAPLTFKRRRIGHSACSLPLPFACDPPQNTPVIEAYIMQNTISASFDNGQPLGLFSASFTCDMGGYCWQGSVTVSPDDFVKLNMDGRHKGQEAVITCQINGDTFVIAAEEYSDNRQFGQKSYTVSGRSLTAYLGDDYADKGDGTYRAPIYAAQIANEQLRNSGYAIDNWAAADWLIPANVYSLTDKSPMAVIQELAAAAGAFVCSDTAKPALRVRPKWPKAAWEIANAEADVSVPSSVIFKISGQKNVSERANGVFVWATHNVGAAADVYRQGSDREPRASAVSGALYTDQPVLLAAGIAALSATGTHKKETVTLPVSDKYAIPLAQLGQIWQINEPTGAFKGVVTGVTLEVGIDNDAPTVTQSVVIDRYLDV